MILTLPQTAPEGMSILKQPLAKARGGGHSRALCTGHPPCLTPPGLDWYWYCTAPCGQFSMFLGTKHVQPTSFLIGPSLLLPPGPIRVAQEFSTPLN